MYLLFSVPLQHTLPSSRQSMALQMYLVKFTFGMCLFSALVLVMKVYIPNISVSESISFHMFLSFIM